MAMNAEDIRKEPMEVSFKVQSVGDEFLERVFGLDFGAERTAYVLGVKHCRRERVACPSFWRHPIAWLRWNPFLTTTVVIKLEVDSVHIDRGPEEKDLHATHSIPLHFVSKPEREEVTHMSDENKNPDEETQETPGTSDEQTDTPDTEQEQANDEQSEAASEASEPASDSADEQPAPPTSPETDSEAGEGDSSTPPPPSGGEEG